MKRSTLKFTGILLTLALFLSVAVQAQQTQERSVGSFSSIHQHTSADVYITKGSVGMVKVIADDDAIDKLKTEVRNGVLHIESTSNGWRNVRTMEVHITMPTIETIKNSGSGDFLIEGAIPGNNVYIGISGSGDLKAEFAATNLEIKISGSGDVSLSGVKGDLAVSVSGSGDVYAEDLKLDNCNISGTGSGDLKLKGKAATFVASIMGSGDINAYGLTAVNVKVKCNGSGDVVVQAVEKVTATLNGSGDLTYYGSPEYVDVESNGSGEVYRK